MDAELILLRLFGGVRSHFCVSIRPAITHYLFGMPRVFQSDRCGEGHLWLARFGVALLPAGAAWTNTVDYAFAPRQPGPDTLLL